MPQLAIGGAASGRRVRCSPRAGNLPPVRCHYLSRTTSRAFGAHRRPGVQETLPATADGASSLWRNPEFLKRWAGQSASLVGSQVTRVALPLTAVLLLDATPAQMALLQAVEAVPHLALGFAAGVWVDR